MYWIVSQLGTSGRRQTPSQPTFWIREMHDAIGECTILFREFGFGPFSDEVGQNLRFDSSSWLIGYVEREELNGPFGNPARCIAVVYDIVKGYFRGYCYRTLLK